MRRFENQAVVAQSELVAVIESDVVLEAAELHDEPVMLDAGRIADLSHPGHYD
jgi:hypothetical protein